MNPFDIVPKAPATSDPQQFQFTPPPEPQPEAPASAYATPPPRHYGIFQRLMGVQHAVEAQDKADEVKFLQDAIHNAIQDQTGKIPPKQIMDWTNRLGQLIQHPEVTKALKSHVQGTLDSRAAGKALAQVNATQAQNQTGMGVPAIPGQTPAAAPTPPQRPPGLPAPPSGPVVPFGSGEQAGGAAPQANIPLPVRASSVKGSAGFGTTPLIPLGSHFNDPTEIAVNKANADIAAQRVMAGYASEQIANGMNRLRAMGIDPSKLTATQVSEFFSKGIIPSVGARVIPRGSTEVLDTGEIRYGMPEPIQTAPGATTTIPSLPGGVQPGVAFNPNNPMQATPAGITGSGPSAAFGAPGTSLSVPALLDPDKAGFLSAAQRTAEKYKVPFDPARNPLNPLAQLPIKYHKEVEALYREEKQDPEIRQMRLDNADSMRNARDSMEALRNVQQQMLTLNRSDRSFNNSQRELDVLGTPIRDKVERLSRLVYTIDSKLPAVDPTIAPELMTVLAGGMGSGVKITQSEIDSVFGGRNKAEDLKALIGRWSIDPAKGLKFTDAQRAQLSKFLQGISDRLVIKHEALTDGYRGIAASTDPTEHRSIVNKVREKFADVDMGKPAATMTAPPGKMLVRDKTDNQKGMIDVKDFNPKTMEKL